MNNRDEGDRRTHRSKTGQKLFPKGTIKSRFEDIKAYDKAHKDEMKRSMKPMYRTAAEEALILAAIKERGASDALIPHEKWLQKWMNYDDAVRAVVRERKEGKRGR